MWQDLLPPERNKLGPKRALRESLAEWSGRMALGAVPVALASAVVVRSLGFTVIGDVLGGVALGLLVGFAAEPLWHWSRRRAASWWR
jgi:hypothetical protein